MTPARDTWHCFGCGKHGDIFTFLMERDGLSFPEALRALAARAGIEIDEQTRREDARKARLREVLESAIAFYHAVLLHSKGGATALAYLRERGFTDETIERYQLGWAPGRLGHDDPPARDPSARSRPASWWRSAWPAHASAGEACTTGSASGSSSRSGTATGTESA